MTTLFRPRIRKIIHDPYTLLIITNVLYIERLLAPSRIYIRRNYIGEAVEKITGFLQARPETLFNHTRLYRTFYQKMDKIYKSLMMEKISQQLESHNENKKYNTLGKAEQKIQNCVSKNLNVAVDKRIIIKSQDVEKSEFRKQNLNGNFNGNLTYPQKDIVSISRKWTQGIDHTHKSLHSSLKRKESLPLGPKLHNISCNAMQQISHLNNEKVKKVSEEKSTNSNKPQPHRANFKHFFQQKKQLWNQQKESKSKIRKQKEKADLRRGSQFYEFCRRNNLTIQFNEYISDTPIISFQNKLPLPKQWRIKNINQQFAIKKLLITTYGKNNYYKLEIEIKDKFQHIAPIKQNQYRELLKILKPWTQLRDNLRSTQYRTIPNENGPLIKKKEQYDPSNNIHEIVLKDAFISIEYLQFLTIILDKEKKPEIIEVSISLRDNTDKFIMVKQCPNNDSNDNDKLPKQPKKSDPVNNVDLYHVKPLFLKVIQMVTGVDKRQMSFSYKEIASHLTKYIFMNKDRFINKNNISIAHIRDDPLGLAFDVDYLHRTQVMTLIRKQLIPISHIKGENELLEANNIEKNQLEEDTEQKINVSLDERIQTLMMQSQALRILCND